MKFSRRTIAAALLLAAGLIPADAGKLVNRAMMTVSGTPGTGTITLGSAVSGYQTFAAAGVGNADVVSYIIEDGTNWEYGQGTYTSTGTTLARTTVQGSSNAGAAISATSSARVFLSALASDIVTPDSTTTFTNKTFSGKIPSTLAITTDYTIDVTGNGVSLANGGTLQLATGAGLVVLNASAGNETGLFLIGGGSVSLIGQAGNGAVTWVANTASPAANQASLYYDSTAAKYTVKSNMGATYTVTAAGIRLNAGN